MQVRALIDMKIKEKIHSGGGCICCPQIADVLAMDELLYQGFGGYHVEKDGKSYYFADSKLEWDQFKRLRDIERPARRSPKSVWRVILNNPLRGSTWERRRGLWQLTETNQGFA